ncbi:hypothetical protein NL108_013853 [Boleophthalmus pectinirostris]|uniref:zinc finger protein 316-like n=1 Tax=Boleophthalmus pectinirostris TaxID=150288 RepID=UPI0024311214|nr:zinc finger protein 316-like [Boleophthalmus pectinirostris]KAJ0051111.1 hypothetical protein NL108_013853 [Boleophthalmus pectinirostris]
MMSVKSHAPKDLVVERLVVAADEIFALFERAFAEYEEEVLRSRFLQQPRDVFHKEDFHLLPSRAQAAKDSEAFMNKSMMMSVKTQALKDLVVEKLVVAADEIFELFERTFAQFEEEALQSRYLPQPPEGLNKPDFQTVIVGLNVGADQVREEEPIKIKQEADPPMELRYSPVTVKSEEPEPEETRPDPSGEQGDGEEPGCSTHLSLDNNRRPFSCSDDDSDEETAKSNGEEPNASPTKDPAENHVNNVGRDNSFSSNSTVTVSKETENRDKLPKCNLCYKTFKSIKALERHLEFHPGPFTCEICSKVHSDRSNYKKHLRIHAEQKPFRCSVCERGFTQKRHMNEHMRIHTGEKPLSCSDCGMTFRQKNSLMRHVLSKHSEHKPYSCPICMKGFVQKWHLVVHMRGHTGERPFSCSVCDRSFESKCYLKKHMDRNHKADGEIPSEVLDSGLCPSLDWEQDTLDETL